ncbi:MAG: SCO1664 family protein [Nocardioidaceae bacterium]|nr:SCO1664 family protein [Nocardioidaceae bacterium]
MSAHARTVSGALRTEPPTVLDDEAVETILEHGSLELVGRLPSASNASFLATTTLDGVELACVYKPIAGERPLWDFPDGNLAGREYAARLISQASGFDVVPPTVLRDGRFGSGMCQRWVETELEQSLIDVVATDFDEPGWLVVLEAEDHRGDPVFLVHADDERLRDMAVFDSVINNADRKGGHVLLEPPGEDVVVSDNRTSLWGCDHGVTLHHEDKLRTVLWGWGGEPLRDEDVDRISALVLALDAELGRRLAPHLTRRELDALTARALILRSGDAMPLPTERWPVIPWPPF